MCRYGLDSSSCGEVAEGSCVNSNELLVLKKTWGISSLPEKPLDSQGGLYTMEFWSVGRSVGW